MSTMTIELPQYAFPYSHPAAQKGDVGAEFRGDDGMSICISLERTEGGMVNLIMIRGGLSESCFTRDELGRVLELSRVLFESNGKQPQRKKI